MNPLSTIRARATYGNVAATLALFIALGGGSFAVAALSRDDKMVVKRIATRQADKQIKKRVRSASVNAGGGVVSNRSEGIEAANISHPEDGAYCLHGLKPAPKNGRGFDRRTPRRRLHDRRRPHQHRLPVIRNPVRGAHV